jgi:glycosyltransferase involved in cell wall biosynthesis
MNRQSNQAPVSVIIPCYRCTATLERAVLSIAAQSYVPAEVILVDDCSADDTTALMQRIAGQYAPGWIRIVLLDQNMGAASARNAGWAVATQAYIAFLDSDDAWHPEKIRIQFDYMQAHPDVVLCGHAHKILPTPAMPDWTLRIAGRHPKVKRITKWGLLLSNRFVTPSVMLKRDIPQRFEERQRYMEDHMLWLNIVCSGAPVDRLAIPLAAIYKRPYGQAGLSSQWWLMERGDLGNYRRLLLQSYITQLQFLGFAVYSVAKFLRRYVLYNLFAPRLK